MLSSLLVDSVYYLPRKPVSPFVIRTLSENSRKSADAMLVHEKNSVYFEQVTDPSPNLLTRFSTLTLQSTDQLQKNYCHFMLTHHLQFDQWIGITGTNGKTTTTFYLEQMLLTQYKVATIGTLGVRINGEALHANYSSNTTLPLMELIDALGNAMASGCTIVIMEASSIGFIEKRLEYIPFTCMIGHKVTHDHLDYHGSFEEYLNVKKSIMRLSEIGIVSKSALLQGLSSSNTTVVLEQSTFNELNAACARVCCEVLRLNYTFSELVHPPGRFEKYEVNGRTIIIDYAHTPHALENLLENCPYDSTIVIGCGGDRDRKKRGTIGCIASKQCKRVIFTLDNPRFEEPLQPLLDMKKNAPNALVMPDRKVAIWYALETSNVGETIIIAGKGNEREIAYRGVSIPFHDKAIIFEWAGQSQRMSL